MTKNELIRNTLANLLGESVPEMADNEGLRRILYVLENGEDGVDRFGTDRELWRMILGFFEGSEISGEVDHNLVLRMIIEQIDGTLPGQMSDWWCLQYISENLVGLLQGDEPMTTEGVNLTTEGVILTH